MKKYTSWLFLVLAPHGVPLFPHDAWLSAKWDSTKANIIIVPLVGEAFPKGDIIKDHTRFVEPSAFLLGGKRIALASPRSDSTSLGALPAAPSCVVYAGVKQREITYDEKVAWEYLTEEIGLSRDDASKFITPGVKEFSEAYSRNLKAVITIGKAQPKDSVIGLPLELVLLSWKDTTDGKAVVEVQLLEAGKPTANTSVRVVSKGKTTLIRTNVSGIAQVIIDTTEPVLVAYIQLKKQSESRFQSVWTNLAIYKLPE